MKVLNEKQTEKLLKTNDVGLLKKLLKIKNKEDNYKITLEYLKQTLYNYKEEQEDLIYKLLELLEQDITTTQDFIEKYQKIINFRTNYLSINQILYKKTRNINDPYSDLINIMKTIDNLDKKLDQEVKHTKVNYQNINFYQTIKFLEQQTKNQNIENLDIINKILHILEQNSNLETNKILEKTKLLEELKTQIKQKITQKNNSYKKEKENLNNLNYIYQKLEKIENNISNNIKETKQEENFSYLINHLEILISNLSERNASSIYKTLELLKQEIKPENNKHTEELENILKLKTQLQIRQKQKNSHSKTYYIKDIINRLENIEKEIIYSINKKENLNDNEVLKTIIFNIENINYTENLINQNPSLINKYNLEEDLLNKILIKLLEELKNKNISYKKICYYSKTLELLIKNPNIIKDQNKEDSLLTTITKSYQELLEQNKTNEFLTNWYQNTISKIKKQEPNQTEEGLNKRYNIIIPSYKKTKYQTKKTKTDNFIITIDEEKDVNKDDAISVTKINKELYNLKVYIADPTSIMNIKSYPIKCARNNCTAIYLKDKKIDMFHPKIIKKYLSLEERKIRNVKVYNFLLDTKGNLLAFEITKESPKITKNYSYKEFNRLQNICYSKKEEKLIDNLNMIKKILTSKNNITSKIINNEITTAEQLIATIMIYTNNKVAEYFAKEGKPFIYRHYDETENKNQNKGTIYNTNNYLDEITKEQGTAIYSVTSKNHDALGLGHYTHVTSPNRRYADIVANQCIDKFYFNNPSEKETKEFEKYLENETNYINDRLIGIDNYYEDYAKYVLTRK